MHSHIVRSRMQMISNPTRAVLYKSFLLKFRSPVSSAFELLFPSILMGLFVTFTKDTPAAATMMIFNTLIFLSFSLTLSRLISSVVSERETRVRELLRISGLSNLQFYTSWWLFYALLMTFVCLSIVPWIVYGALVPDTDPIILFAFYLSFCFASISFSLFLSSPFNSAKVAQSIGFLIFFLINQLGSILTNPQQDQNNWLLPRMFPPLTFSAGNNKSISFVECIGVNTINTVVYFLLYVYFDSVLPHKIGTRLAWNFPLTFFFAIIRNSSATDSDETQSLSLQPSDSPDCLDVVRLTKAYPELIALDSVSMQLTCNEITVLLGKNGAGKTTLINILTGLTEPTSGHVSAPPHTVFGLCPQHDIVWPELTVDDHFEIFGKLRGMIREDIYKQRNHLVGVLGIPVDHRSFAVKTLSGGTKRKLAVGLAFLGNHDGSKIVILDEPTSGLDPFSRRQLWDAILRLKDHRIVLLSTHYMDEAEVLGDRIVILAQGKVRANGSSIQLRRQFDCGYTFTIKGGENLKEIGNVVQSIVGEVSVEIFSDKAQIFVPMDLENVIEPLLTELNDCNRNSALVTVQSTRLEEVFMRVTCAPSGSHKLPAFTTTSSGYEEFDDSSSLSTAPKPVIKISTLSSISAIVIKRYRMFFRDLRTSVVHHLYPILVIVFGLFVRKSTTSEFDLDSSERPPEALLKSMDNLMLVLFVSVAFSSVPSSISHLINSEKHSHSKFLQYISGLSPIVYWIGNLVADLTEYFLFPFGITVMLFNLFADQIPTEPLVYLLIPFGPAIIAQTYLLTIMIPNPAIAQLVSVILSTVVGGILPMVGFLFTQANFLTKKIGDDDAIVANPHLETVLGIARIFPAYNLGQGLVTIPMAGLVDQLAHAIDPSSKAAGMYAWTNLGAPLFWMVIAAPIYFLLTLVLDHAIYTHKFSRMFGLMRRSEPTGFMQLSSAETDEEEDESILRERERVLDTADPPLLRVMSVSKQYSIRSNFFAVNRVSLGIPNSGEVFGLLGHNGAGKSTLMKMCTGEILPTIGDIVLSPNLNTKFDVAKFHSIVGYCPQFDALIDALTVRDHLELYGAIKGIARGPPLAVAVDDLLVRLGLIDYEFTKVKYLSGGYKRRVSLGIALIGSPVLLLLDEPTCGMDPVARRQTWTIIKSVALNSASVVLTTHSMEEAESISTRVGIMSKGKMVCVGSVEQLREKFSNGIEIFMQTKFVDLDKEILTNIQSKESFLVVCEEHSAKRAKRFLASGLSVLSSASAIPFCEWWSQEQLNDKLEELIWSELSPQGTVVSSVSASGRSIRMVLLPSQMNLGFLVSIFALLSKIRLSGDIVDFSVNQNSLEQVFNSITAIEADVDGDRDQSAEHMSQLQ